MTAPAEYLGRPTNERLRAVPDPSRLAGLTDASAPALDDDSGSFWDDPTPLGLGRSLPPFPLEVFPGWVRDQVEAVTVFQQTPPDLAGCIVLAALATAAGGRAVVEVRAGWREPVNLFTVVALPPGSRKSPVFRALIDPLMTAEQALIDRVAPQIDEAELRRRVAAADAEKAARKAETVTAGQSEAFVDALDAAAVVRGLNVPTVPRLVADDITPETAVSLLAEQGGRLAVLSAEGGIFATLAGRYSGTPNLEVFLKGHAGDLIRVNRKGRDPEHISSPALTLGLAVQPEILKQIAEMPGFRGRGLLGRILYSLPVNTVGHRQIGPPPPPEAVTTAYSHHLTHLVLTLADWTDPAVITLTPAAAAAVLQLETDLEPRLAPGADLSHITDWASKLVGATARIAGLLHLAQHGGDLDAGGLRPLDLDTIRAAARLGSYYLTHALAVFDLMGSDRCTEDARIVLDWITRTGTTTFSRRDAFSGLSRSRFPKAADLEPALLMLEDHGWIRRQATPPTTSAGGRPPSARYDVHPLAAEAAQPAQP
jgi:replicative DNA helicase